VSSSSKFIGCWCIVDEVKQYLLNIWLGMVHYIMTMQLTRGVSILEHVCRQMWTLEQLVLQDTLLLQLTLLPIFPVSLSIPRAVSVHSRKHCVAEVTTDTHCPRQSGAS